MIIANRLDDGRVVFFTAARGWSTAIADGVVLDDKADEDAAFAAAKADEAGCKVIDPNLIEVSGAGANLKPVAIREAIRAFGPTV